jgi:serine phosphatase RsbU (regulator of sigma subunit)
LPYRPSPRRLTSGPIEADPSHPVSLVTEPGRGYLLRPNASCLMPPDRDGDVKCWRGRWHLAPVSSRGEPSAILVASGTVRGQAVGLVLSRPETDKTREELGRALDDLARLARDGIPGCGDASVTVLHDGDARTSAATHPRAVRIDERQYESGAGPCLAAMEEREAVDVPDYSSEARWPEVTAEGRRLGVHSGLSLPLTADGRALGALNLYGDDPGAFGEDSRRVAAAFARQGLVVLRYLEQLHVERARFARERQVAATLQRSLLPSLPELPGISAAARYLVSGSAAQVGGDWYDLFALPDGAIAVAIGDVMGHDVAAAAAMGQLRSVLRSYAYEGISPSIVVDRMDRLVQGFGMAEVATAIYGRLILDRGTGLFLFSNAGHLPPLIRHPGGAVERLDRGTHHLIGALPPGTAGRGEAAAALSAGSLLLLYTDGLVETRTRDFDDGIGLLSSALAGLDDNGTPQQACDVLIEAMVGTDPEDDVAVLAVRIDDPRFA